MKSIFKKHILQKKFKKINSHNQTWMKNIFDINKVIVGKGTYGPLEVRCYGNDKEKLIIGNYCSIAHGTKFILGGEHNYKVFSTYPFKKKFNISGNESITKGEIILEDDVWIGENSLILSGVKIGQGAVIGAGSIVSKNIPPYAIYAGNKVIKYRFSDEIINKLLQIDFDKLDENKIRDNIDLLYTEINEKNVDQIIKLLI